MQKADIHYFGIRHHGPGSARRLVSALEQLKPSVVLIEGPADCSDLLPHLANPQMQPPISLLAYAKDDTVNNIYYPFAEFSPEYQATKWAVENGASLHFIDLPIAVQLTQLATETPKTEMHQEPSTDTLDSQEEYNTSMVVKDPIGLLAALAGYEDGESWWNDLIEQNVGTQDVSNEAFESVELAMGALREQSAVENTNSPNSASQREQVREQQREAFMRLEIAKHAKHIEGAIAVVCGAWHVPALKNKQTAKLDKEILKTLPAKLPKSKVKSTWIPWTSPRLATAYGYGAGVPSPKWYEHLWRHYQNPNSLEHWLTKIAHALRECGQIVSTASVIEAVRLSQSLASLRQRPSPGFEEIREATIACLCFGEEIVWRQVEQELLLGNDVGRVPDNTELVPLLEDLQRLQKKTKLKPEALPKELSIDLRSDIGLMKSVLLHRLNILGVDWGALTNTGRSRGTFREKWQLCWQPEHAISLVENLVYGSTIELAANNKMCEVLTNETQLSTLAEAVQQSLQSQLEHAVDIGLQRLTLCASQTSDCKEILSSIPSLINVSRYGTAREFSLSQVTLLIERLATQATVALPYACRDLNDEEAQNFRLLISNAFDALQLGETNESIITLWFRSFKEIVQSSQSSYLLSGLCSRLLYQSEQFSSEQLQELLQRALSPAVTAMDGARFFEGFFTGAAQRLLYDPILLDSVEHWLLSLDEETFIQFLPLFRRIFSDLDNMERKRLTDKVLGNKQQQETLVDSNAHGLVQWPNQFDKLSKLIDGNAQWMS